MGSEEFEESLLRIGGFSIRPRKSTRKRRNNATANSFATDTSTSQSAFNEDNDTAITIDQPDDTHNTLSLSDINKQKKNVSFNSEATDLPGKDKTALGKTVEAVVGAQGAISEN